MDELLRRALRLADVADGITKRYYRSSELSITTKPDQTPVTQADTEVEQALSKIVVQDFEDYFVGEEGTLTGQGSRRWIVDPIDGTRNFLRGMPVWATLISVSDQGRVQAAVASAPALGRRWWAARGQGAFTSDTGGTERQLHVSGVAAIEHAFVLYGSLLTWEKTPVGMEAVIDFMRSTWRQRAIGDFLNYMLVAEGAADACFEADPKEWDLEAPHFIVAEAGGNSFTNAAPDAPSEQPRISVSSNGLLDPALRQAFTVQ